MIQFALLKEHLDQKVKTDLCGVAVYGALMQIKFCFNKILLIK